jgi:alkanesulfonate monooxygenase SsuD/methylene tetrahydromethanopterin reductase-like flavin-dependent oxidoreductase (luciferase family)
MAAIAVRTERIVTGPLVTPIARRRPHQLARETVTLDRLSGGRFVFGVGLGGNATGEFDHARFAEEEDPKRRAKLLDDGLDQLLRYWDGEFEPRPVQRPRIPIWVASRFPKRTPLARAARYDGWFPIELPGPEALTEQLEVIEGMRGGDLAGYDVAVTNEAGTDPRPWADAGATWCLTGFGSDPSTAAVTAAIDDGP